VTVTAVSSDPSIVPHPTITGSGAMRTLSFTPAEHAFGTVTITVTAMDDGGTADGGVDQSMRTFQIEVVPVNDAPSFDAISDQEVAQDSGTTDVGITGVSAGPANEADQTVALTAVSSDPSIVPHPTIAGTGATRTLSFAPVSGAHGLVTITVTAQDDGGTAHGGQDMFARTFQIMVTAATGDTTPPRVLDVLDVFPDPRNTALSFVDVEFSEPIRLVTLDSSDLSLTLDGVPMAITGPLEFQELNPTTVRISGLDASTAKNGTYALTVHGAGIEDTAGNAGMGSASDTWIKLPAHVFAHFSGQLANSTAQSVVNITISTADFTLAGGKVSLGFWVLADVGSSLNPAAVTITGTSVTNLFANANVTATQSLRLVDLTAGTYQVKVASEAGTSGAWRMAVYLVGDVNGDRTVNTVDRDIILSINGSIEGDAKYRIEADANLDRRITSTDYSYWLRNQGDATRLHPLGLAVEFVPKPTFLPDGTLATTESMIDLAGHTNAGASTALEADGDGDFAEGAAIADAAGLFEFPDVPLNLGLNNFSVRASDGFGQQRLLALALERVSPLQIEQETAEIPAAASAKLDSDTLESIVRHAIARWVAAGISAEQEAVLNAVPYAIAELPGAALGWATRRPGDGSGSAVWIDADAAGLGWFIDVTPAADEEFLIHGDDHELRALRSSGAARGIDLLTVVSHELGHVLGLEDLDPLHSTHELMSATIEPGIRRTPSSIPERAWPEPASAQAAASGFLTAGLSVATTNRADALSTRPSLAMQALDHLLDSQLGGATEPGVPALLIPSAAIEILAPAHARDLANEASTEQTAEQRVDRVLERVRKRTWRIESLIDDVLADTGPVHEKEGRSGANTGK
jgi:hypothetical protein